MATIVGQLDGILRVVSIQVKKVVGFTAPPEFIEEVKNLAASHSRLLVLDCIRAYHFGASFSSTSRFVVRLPDYVNEREHLSHLHRIQLRFIVW